MPEQLSAEEVAGVSQLFAGAQRLSPQIQPTFLCAITHDIMSDPVITPEGYTYDRKAIEAWLDKDSTDPMTRGPLQKSLLIPNRVLKDAIAD